VDGAAGLAGWFATEVDAVVLLASDASVAARLFINAMEFFAVGSSTDS